MSSESTTRKQKHEKWTTFERVKDDSNGLRQIRETLDKLFTPSGLVQLFITLSVATIFITFLLYGVFLYLFQCMMDWIVTGRWYCDWNLILTQLLSFAFLLGVVFLIYKVMMYKVNR